MGEVTAIVVSGTASRFAGSFLPTQFVEFEGRPILAYCLDTYEALPMIDEVALVMDERYEQVYRDLCSTYGYGKVRRFVPGGPTRQESVSRGLRAIDPCGIVVVQEDLRPFASETSIVQAIEAARLHGAADVVVPTLDTIVVERDGFIVDVPDRANLRAGHAPQTFRYDVLIRAHEHARAMGIRDATDDAQLVLASGGQVRAVVGSLDGLELTTGADLLSAQDLLEARQEGLGVADRTLGLAAEPLVEGLLERTVARNGHEADHEPYGAWTKPNGDRSVAI